MLNIITRMFRRLRRMFGVAKDAGEIVVALGLVSIPTGLAVYWTWAKENPEDILLYALGAAALASVLIHSLMRIHDRTAIYRRVKVKQLNVLDGYDHDNGTLLALTGDLRILNRAELPVRMQVQDATLMLEGRVAEKKGDAPFKSHVVLDGDRMGVTLATITHIPKKPLLNGHLHLDMHYGGEDDDFFAYRYEYRGKVNIVVKPDGKLTVTISDPTQTHSKLLGKT